MTDLVFFYGTLMSGFKRPGPFAHRPEADAASAAARFTPTLFDLGIYPAAIPASDDRVLGRSAPHDRRRRACSPQLDEIEGFRPSEPDASLYTRVETPVTFDDGRVATAWAYFYNAPLGRAQRIESGDYLEHLKVK